MTSLECDWLDFEPGSSTLLQAETSIQTGPKAMDSHVACAVAPAGREVNGVETLQGVVTMHAPNAQAGVSTPSCDSNKNTHSMQSMAVTDGAIPFKPGLPCEQLQTETPSRQRQQQQGAQDNQPEQSAVNNMTDKVAHLTQLLNTDWDFIIGRWAV
jgi:hypothetical protein